MSNTRDIWEGPAMTELSVRETKAVNGSDSDAQSGGVFIVEAPDKAPTKIAIPADDSARVRDFLKAISSSPEKLEAAIFEPEEEMVSAGLTKNQIRIAKRVLTHLAR
jgi:hypothetical protein